MHLYSLTVYSFYNNNAETHKNAACDLLIIVAIKEKKLSHLLQESFSTL